MTTVIQPTQWLCVKSSLNAEVKKFERDIFVKFIFFEIIISQEEETSVFFIHSISPGEG